MIAVRHVRSLAVIAGVTGALLMLMGPARAHAAGGSGISNLTTLESQALDKNPNWTPGNDVGNWNDYRRHDPKSVSEPGAFGLYLAALLGGAFFLRARRSRSR